MEEILQPDKESRQQRQVVLGGMGGIGKTRLSAKLGRGGIGKTDLTLQLARGIEDQFEYIIWRRLLSAPKASDILTELIRFLSDQQDINIPDTVDGQISRFIYYLRQKRCLRHRRCRLRFGHTGKCASP